MVKTNIAEIIKLNEELTAENARLLKSNDNLSFRISEVDKLKNDLEVETHSRIRYRNKISDLEKELTSIKSKWWHKLMTWRWN